jgi:transcriptional regulator with XRE-family HTH domain
MTSDDDPQSLAPSSEFGPILRHWRQTRGLSQQGLAERAGMSTRHLSFLETGRCGPSRSAVLQLGKALDVPHAEIERLLLVAGYAGDWTRRFGDPVAIRPQLEKVSHLLAAHDPYPALITTPDWRVGWANRGASGLMRRFREFRPDLCVDPLDLRELFADTHGIEQLVANWSELLEAVVAGLYQLEPDPASFGNTRALMEVLPHDERPGAAIDRACSTALWQHEIRIRDRGVEFGMEFLPLPFAGGASGFALVLAHPSDAESAPIAHEYFSKIATA